jgi:long-chain acyl-CoA synthetase
MIQNEQVQEKYLNEVAKFNELFGNWEQIKRFELLDTPWGIETGELTPTMKLKRKVIMEKYADRVEALYRK